MSTRRGKIPTVLWVALLLSASIANAEISSTEFTAAYVEVVAEEYPDAVVKVVEPLQLSVRLQGSSDMTVYLHNAYTTYSNRPKDLAAILAQYSASLPDYVRAEDAPLAPENIVPVVKDDGWLSAMANATKEAGARTAPDFFNQPLAEGLIVVFAEDTPTSMQYMRKQALIEADINLETIRDDSLKNLREKLPKIELQGADGLYMISAGGDYEASLLLMDGLWNTEKLDIKGDIVVSVPSRDVLLVSGTKNTRALKKLRRAAKKIYAESTYYISPELYVRDGDAWSLLK